MKRNIAALILSVLLALSVTACNSAAEPSADDPGVSPAEEASATDAPEAPDAPDIQPVEEAALAVLGENVVTTTDFLFYYTMYRSNIINSYSQLTDMNTFWDQEYEGKTMKQLLIEDTLQTVKEYSLFHRHAVNDGITLSDEQRKELEEGVQNTLRDYLDGDEQAFLAMFSLTPDQMAAVLERGELATRFRDKALEAIEVSDDEILTFYDENKDGLEQVTARHVLIDCNDSMPEAEQQAAKVKAEGILAELKAGADIGKLAAEHSTDPGSSQSNGEYTFGRGEMVPEFEDWSFGAEPGDQGMVKTDYGYHVMQLMSKTSLDDLKVRITGILREQKFPESYSEILAQLDSPDWQVETELLDEITQDR